MADRLAAAKTPVTIDEMFTALGTGWIQYFGSPPSKESLCILLAQWALETGWGKSMWCNNIGNAKSRDGDGRDYTYFACYEVISGQTKWFYPDDPVCRFRAFKTLALGAMDYLGMLVNNFGGGTSQERDAWHWVGAGDPSAFSHALKLRGYYTASEASYTSNVVSTFHSLMQKPFDVSTCPGFTAEEQEHVANWTMGTDSLVEELVEQHKKEDTESDT